MSEKPRLLVSRCLLGDAVRYDGGHKLNATLRDQIALEHALVPMCPEVEAGMGTPRPAIDLFDTHEQIRALDRAGHVDWTDGLSRVAKGIVRRLQTHPVDGCVWKAKSPSCGWGTAKRYDASGDFEQADGLVAAEVSAAFAGLPMIDERGLEDPEERSIFEAAVAIMFLRRTETVWPDNDWSATILNVVCKSETLRPTSEGTTPQLSWPELALRLRGCSMEARRGFATSSRAVHRTIGAVIAGAEVPLKSER